MGYLISNIMRYFFYHLYHSFAWSYNIVANLVSSGNWFEWVKYLIEFVDIRESILEVGFGTGVLQEALIKRGFDISGIDESSQMIRISKKRTIKFGDKLKIVRGTAFKMPFPDNYFDKVIATFPSDYFLNEKFVSELERILKPHGAFIALIAVKFNRATFLDRFYRIIFSATNQQINSFIGDKLTRTLGEFATFTNELSWKNYKGRSLCFLILRRF